MLKNYFKIALRKIFRQRIYATINILGLSVGLTVSLLIFLWVQDELKMDQFHEDGDQIFKVLANVESNGNIQTWKGTPYPLIDHLATNYPEVTDVGAYDNTNKKQFLAGEQEMLADGIYADPGFFRILNFPFVEGNRREIFSNPNGVVISEKLAGRLFGKDWKGFALGETVSINGQTNYKVTGVFSDTPEDSSLRFDFALSLDQLHKDNNNEWPWGTYSTDVIFKLKEQIDPASFEQKIANVILEKNKHEEGVALTIQPYGRSYLYAQFENGKEVGGRIEYVRLFGFAAIFLLMIACINFMNLATARASKQAKEVGIRKTIGANKRSLVIQFMTEAAIITGISIFVAVLLSNLLLPSFQEISGKELMINFASPQLWATIVITSIFTALLAGSYPSFFLSSFRITNILKNKLSNKFSGNNLRHSLVVFQFVFSALLVIGAMVVQSQVNFIKTKHLGLDKENILYFRTPPEARDKMEAYKSELLQIPGITQLTFSNTNPLSVGSQTGDPNWEGMFPDESMLFNVLTTDDNFLQTMNIPLKTGDDFTALLSSDSVGYLINETAAKIMKLGQPIGKHMQFWGVGGPIIGVVEDFHIGSLHKDIGPLIIAHFPQRTRLTMLRVDPNSTNDIIAASQQVFEKFSAGYPFRYDFLDERFSQMYRSEQRIENLSWWFALIALFISCLGLLGLSTFIAEQKSKEISIRKVLGATVYHIVFLLSKDFLKLITIALAIAFPIAWYTMNDWLANYAFSIELSWHFFALAGMIAIAVVLLTISYQSAKAILSNPIDSLKTE